MWQWTGQQRPDFAEAPGPGQESVWDYPRPPVLDASSEHVAVYVAGTSDDAAGVGRLIAESNRCQRVLETASPPTYYLPPDCVDWSLLQGVDSHSSVCEWKGRASYFSLQGEDAIVAWRYERPSRRFAAIDGFLSFYPSRVACFVDGERVRPQPGRFYGGWITDRVTGPFKGEPGTGHW